MITDGKNWHYLAVTNLSALLQGNSSNHEEDFYCLNCFSSYTTKNKLKGHDEICNNHDSCNIEMIAAIKNTKIQSWRKIFKSTICNLSRFRMFIKKRNNLVKTIPKNLAHRKKLDLSLLVGQCPQDVHLIKKKINLIITEEKIVLKNYVKS